MTIEEQLKNHEERIAALEARQPSPHNTPETNPWMGRSPQSEPKQPISGDFQQVFGFWADPLGRRLIPPGSEDEAIWLTKQKGFLGFADIPVELTSKVSAIVETFVAQDMDATPKGVNFNGQTYLVFPSLPGVGYGTPRCFMMGVSVLGVYDLDRAIEVIQQRMAK